MGRNAEETVSVTEAPPLTQAQRDELERRWQSFQENPNEGEDWEDVKAELLND